MLKKIFLLFLVSGILYLESNSSISAQSCGERCLNGICNPGLGCSAGDICSGLGCAACVGISSGNPGACESAGNCTNPAWNEGGNSPLVAPYSGANTCSEWGSQNGISGAICCAPSTANLGQCLDACTNDAECDATQSLRCSSTTNTCVSSSGSCSLCVGNSGDSGSCTSSSNCDSYGFTTDGQGTCPGGYICCTAALTNNQCRLSVPNPFPPNTPTTVSLTSDTAGFAYSIQASGTGNCSCDPDTLITDASGNAVFTCSCGPGGASINLTALGENASCSTRFTIADDLGSRFCTLDVSSLSDGSSSISISSSVPNENYWLTGYWSSETGSGLCTCSHGFIATDGSGQGSDSCTCPVNRCGSTVTMRARSFTNIPSEIICSGFAVLSAIDPAKPIFCCSANNTSPLKINTALGCISSEIKAFTSDYSKWSLGIGGAFTLLVIVIGAVYIITGSHDPKKIQAGQELITAALAGTAIIILSILIINYLGAKVLGLGPLGFKQ